MTGRQKSLIVWMNGERVGEWRHLVSGNADQFRYFDGWIESPSARPLSLSLPLRHSEHPYGGPIVRNYFDNLLPDSPEIRRRIQTRFETASTEPFDLLAEIGRDCVGAVQLLPPNIEPEDVRTIRGTPLSDLDIEQLLEGRGASSSPVGRREFRISIAGVQEKTALLRHDGRWMEPLGSTPTTHIFKLPIGRTVDFDLSTSVENEWLCHSLLEAYGIPVASCEMARYGHQAVLIVERFDRAMAPDGTWLIRLPQEDMCQACGIPPEKKYESDGGPGIFSINEILLGSVQAYADRVDFFRTQVAFWLLCATDGHAKNFSIALLPRGHFRLTPRYDVLSVYPMLGHGSERIHPREVRMAMAIWGKTRHYNWETIHRRHWVATAKRCGLLAEEVDRIIDSLVEQTPRAIADTQRLLPSDFPTHVSEPIFKGLSSSAERLGRRDQSP